MTVSIESLDGLFADGSSVEGVSDIPVVVHVGLHKTATTWLQNKVIAPKHGVEISACIDFSATHAAFLLQPSGGFSVEHALDLMKPYLENARHSGLPLFISDEALAGHPVGGKHDRLIVATRLKKTFPNAKVLVTIREQAALLRSMYGEYLKSGGTSSIDNFVIDVPPGGLHEPIIQPRFYDYDQLLTFYETIFGAERVSIVPMESLIGRPGNAITLLSNLFGTSLSPLEGDAEAKVENPNWGKAAHKTLRFLNRFHSPDSRWVWHNAGWIMRKVSPTSLAYRVNCWTPDNFKKAWAEEEVANVRRRIGERYSVSNARFSERTGISLGELGYLCDG